MSAHFEVLEKIFSRYGLPFTSEMQQEILKLSAKNLPSYFDLKFGKDAHASLALYRKLTIESFPSIRAFPGIVELLDFLRSQEVGLALWTAREMETT